MQVFYSSLRSSGHYVLASIDLEPWKKNIFQILREGSGGTEKDIFSNAFSSADLMLSLSRRKFLTLLSAVCPK